MTEDAFVDTRVKEFADHIQCDPELDQELYFKHKVSAALDNEQKASMRRELSTLQIVSNNLDRAAKACKGLSLYDCFLTNHFFWFPFLSKRAPSSSKHHHF